MFVSMAKAPCFVALCIWHVFEVADEHWKEVVGCTAVALDGAGSVDGSGFAGMNADSGAGDWRLSFVPAKDHEEGALRPVYPQKLGYPRFIGYGRGAIYHPERYPGYDASVALAHIPEVKHTHGYWESLQPLMNDQGLGLGESSCGAMLMNKAHGDTTDKRNVPTGLLDTAALMQLALERCATARCAVETMGNLSEEHGFGPTPGEVAGLASCQGRDCWDDAGEAYTISDKSGEVWIFHVIGGVSGIINAVWVGQKVPKGHLAVVANEFTIGELPDKPNSDYLFNPKIRDAAIAAKLWDGKGTLNWKRVFAPESVTLSLQQAPLRFHFMRRCVNGACTI
jgi:dipeptidase